MDSRRRRKRLNERRGFWSLKVGGRGTGGRQRDRDRERGGERERRG